MAPSEGDTAAGTCQDRTPVLSIHSISQGTPVPPTLSSEGTQGKHGSPQNAFLRKAESGIYQLTLNLYGG